MQSISNNRESETIKYIGIALVYNPINIYFPQYCRTVRQSSIKLYIFYILPLGQTSITAKIIVLWIA